jgi:hypothetical protein
MRSLLRRFLNDVAKVEFDDDNELDELLLFGLHDMQEYIMAIDKEAFAQWDNADVKVNVRHYPRPLGSRFEFELAYSSDPTTNVYRPLSRVEYGDMRRRESGVYSESMDRDRDIALTDVVTSDNLGQYSIIGKYYYLGWNPEATIVNGLEIVHHPLLTMATDTDVPELPIWMHRGIVYSAFLQAVLETPADVTKIERELARIVGKINRHYEKSANNALTIRADLRKGRAFGSR